MLAASSETETRTMTRSNKTKEATFTPSRQPQGPNETNGFLAMPRLRAQHGKPSIEQVIEMRRKSEEREKQKKVEDEKEKRKEEEKSIKKKKRVNMSY